MTRRILTLCLMAASLAFATVADAQWPVAPAPRHPTAPSAARPAAAHRGPAYVTPAPAQPARVAMYRPSVQGGVATAAYAYVPPYYWRASAPAPDRGAPNLEEKRSVAFDLTVGTQFPLGIGPKLSLEVPGRVLLQAELAWMPPAYASAVMGLTSPEGEDARVIVGVIERALADSVVGRASVGWRPLPNYGFELTGGYTHVSLSTTAVSEDVAPFVDGAVAKQIASLAADVPLSVTLHNVHVAVGWRWLAANDRLVVRATVGYTQTVGASSSIELPKDTPFAAEAKRAFSQATDSLLVENVKLPVGGMSLGYRF